MTQLTEMLAGQRVGRYEIQERIGAGGMARVFKAWDANLERLVAIKILHEHLAEDQTFKIRFDREARLVASLNHPNIVRVYDFDTIQLAGQTVSYMVMPYIAGQTLTDLLEEYCARSERMPRDRVLAIITCLASALAYAHSRGMVHRDVKPGNILFDESGQPILTDFGIARLAEAAHLTQEGATVGTPTYISPEQAAGRQVDSRADLYALGVILYEMLTGSPPFEADSSISLILKHLNDPIPSISDHLPDSDPQLDAFMFKALAKSPDDRFQSAGEFLDQLRLALDGSQPSVVPDIATAFTLTPPPVSTEPMTPAPIVPPSSPAVRSTRLWLAAGLLIAVATVIAALIALRPPAREAVVNSMTGDESIYFVSSFSPDDTYTGGWQQTAEGAVRRFISGDGLYYIENDLVDTAVTALYDPAFVYQDATITLEGWLDEASAAESAFGIVFRYQDERNYNVFAVDGLGRYSLWSLEDGTWSELRQAETRWTPGEFINPLSEKNQLTVTFAGSHIIGTVNGQVVVDLELDSLPLTSGRVGVYTASTREGRARAVIDVYQVSGEIPAMTGG